MLAPPPPQFPGDDWTEMRAICVRWYPTLSAYFVGRMADTYERAAKINGTETDPIARQLRRSRDFDLNKLKPALDHLAAVWRHRTGRHVFEGVRPDPDEVYDSLRDWLLGESALWFWDNPYLVRHVCRTVTQVRPGTSDEPGEALLRELRLFYPLPLAAATA